MTNKELKDILSKYPDDSIVMYRHNKCGRIDVDYVDYKEETLLSENKVRTITFEATFEEE